MITLPAPTIEVLHICYTVVAPSTQLQLNYYGVVAPTSLLLLLPFSCCSVIAPHQQQRIFRQVRHDDQAQ